MFCYTDRTGKMPKAPSKLFIIKQFDEINKEN